MEQLKYHITNIGLGKESITTGMSREYAHVDTNKIVTVVSSIRRDSRSCTRMRQENPRAAPNRPQLLARHYLENHVQIIVLTNDFFQFDDIGMTDLLQRLQRTCHDTARRQSTRCTLISRRSIHSCQESCERERDTYRTEEVTLRRIFLLSLTIFLLHSKYSLIR